MQPSSPRRPRQSGVGASHGLALTDHQLPLALMEAQIGALLEVLPIALLVTTDEGEVLRANYSAATLFGAERAIIGTPVKKCCAYGDTPRCCFQLGR